MKATKTDDLIMLMDQHYIESEIRFGRISDDISAIEFSIEKHTKNLNLLINGYTLPREAFGRYSEPMCMWIKANWEKREFRCVSQTIWGSRELACPLSSRKYCNGYSCCCDGIRDKLNLVYRNTERMIAYEKAIINFMKEILEKLKRKFEKFDFVIRVETSKDLKTLWSLFNVCDLDILKRGEGIGLTLDEISSTRSWWDRLNEKIIKFGLK